MTIVSTDGGVLQLVLLLFTAASKPKEMWVLEQCMVVLQVKIRVVFKATGAVYLFLM